MGFLNQNTTFLGSNIDFPMLEGYCGSHGAALAAVEGAQNDFAIFEAALQADFQEAAALKEGAELAPIQEASIGGFFSKIIEFFKKLGAKIKSIFTAFTAKLDSYLKKDTKEFVNKYRTVVTKKGDFSKMKAKFAEPKSNTYTYGKPYPVIMLSGLSAASNDNAVDDFDRDEYIEDICKDIVGTDCNLKELQKEIHDKLYDDEETKDDWSMGDINSVMVRLQGADKEVSALRKINDNLQNTIKKVIADLTKMQNNTSKAFPVKDGETTTVSGVRMTYTADGSTKRRSGMNDNDTRVNKDEAVKLQRMLSLMQMQAGAHQSVILSYSSAVMNEAKWGIAQDRRIFAKAVAYNPKSVKENALLLDAIGECAQAECEEAFEFMEMIA